jgi:spore coat protein H
MNNCALYCVVVSAALTASLLSGCSSESSGSTSGNAGTSATKEKPDYALAFPQDTVPRLDIVISKENWQSMVDDMTTNLGAFGSSAAPAGAGGAGNSGGAGSGGMMLPQALIDACNGLKAGDACSATFMGMDISSKCADLNGSLLCTPGNVMGGMGGGTGVTGGMGGMGGAGMNMNNSPNPIYVECDVNAADRSWQHVGIRFKGNSSLSSSWRSGVWKMPLHLSFDKYESTYPETKNQRFYGFKELSLSNGWSDTSLMRDKIGTEVFVNAGIKAPATAFYRIYIDHGDGVTYFGLYTGIEFVSDDSFLDSAFGDHSGNLYKPEGTGAQWAQWDSATLGKQNNVAKADFSDAQALFDALHGDRTDAAAWRTELDAHFDTDQFLHWLALNTVAQDWDTYGQMSHNYYLYGVPSNAGKLQWIPWDHSFAFSATGLGLGNPPSLGLAEISDQWPLIRYLIDDPEYLKTYKGYVSQAAATEYEPVSAETRFQAAHDLIKPYVVGADGEIKGYTFLTSDADFDDALAKLIAHVKTRQKDVATYLAQ